MKEVILAWSFFQYHLSLVWIRSDNDFSGAGATWYSNMSTVTQTSLKKRLTSRQHNGINHHTHNFLFWFIFIVGFKSTLIYRAN